MASVNDLKDIKLSCSLLNGVTKSTVEKDKGIKLDNFSVINYQTELEFIPMKNIDRWILKVYWIADGYDQKYTPEQIVTYILSDLWVDIRDNKLTEIGI